MIKQTASRYSEPITETVALQTRASVETKMETQKEITALTLNGVFFSGARLCFENNRVVKGIKSTEQLSTDFR